MVVEDGVDVQVGHEVPLLGVVSYVGDCMTAD